MRLAWLALCVLVIFTAVYTDKYIVTTGVAIGQLTSRKTPILNMYAHYVGDDIPDS